MAAAKVRTIRRVQGYGELTAGFLDCFQHGRSAGAYAGGTNLIDRHATAS
jgi:hypothetical protein